MITITYVYRRHNANICLHSVLRNENQVILKIFFIISVNVLCATFANIHVGVFVKKKKKLKDDNVGSLFQFYTNRPTLNRWGTFTM